MKKENLENLERTLWKGASILWGSLDAGDYKDIFFPMFFLKHVNDVFEAKRKTTEDLFKEDVNTYVKEGLLFLPEESRWQFLLEKSNSPQLKNILSDALTAMSNVEENKEKLKNVFIKNYFINPKYDVKILKKILFLFENEIKIENDERDIYGFIYEYFLKHFALESAGKGGEFYTPKPIVELLINLLKPIRGKIYDPCFGTGGMFIHAHNYIKKNHSEEDLKNTIFIGQEKNYTTWRLSKMNMIFNNMDSKLLGEKSACTFLNDLHTKENYKMNYIFANPPFNLKEYWDEKLETDPRWIFGTPPKGNANYAWIQHIISKLAPNGKAAVVMSLGALTSQSAKKVRENLIKANIIDAILVLPDKLFYSTGIGCSVWIFNKHKINKNILMATFGNDFGIMMKQQRELTPGDIQQVSDIYQQHLEGKLINKPNRHHIATPEEVEEKDFSLLPNEFIEYLEKPIDWKLFKKTTDELKKNSEESSKAGKLVDSLLKEMLESRNK